LKNEPVAIYFAGTEPISMSGSQVAMPGKMHKITMGRLMANGAGAWSAAV
jgi:hypothetical protein